MIKLTLWLVFFGINLRPSSSKDPYAIRRTAISVVRLIIENNLKVKLRDLINYSCVFYKEQGFEFDLKKLNLEQIYMMMLFKSILTKLI